MTTNWTIDGVKEALAAKKISARELAAEFYKRIEEKNPELNAYLALSPERARRFCRTMFRRTMPLRLRGWKRPVRSSWERRTATSSQWEARMRTRHTGR